MRERLRRNLTGKFLGELGARVISFAFNLALARGLGAEGFGRWGWAYAFAGTLALCGELGLNSLLTREAARDRERAGAWLRAFAPLRWGSILLVGLGTAGLALSLPDRARTLEVVLMAVFMAANTGLDYHTAVFTAFERMAEDARFRVTTRLLVSGAGIVAVALGAKLIAVLATVAVANVLAVGLGSLWRRKDGLSFGVGWEPGFVRVALVAAVPTAAAWIAHSLYFYLDNLVLAVLGASDAAIGQYNAALKILDASQALPLIVVGGTYPVVAELAASGDPSRLAPFFTRVARLCLVLGAPIAGVAAVFSPMVARLFYGAGYDSTGPALAVLALAAPPYFSNLVALQLLVAAGHPWAAAAFRLGSAALKVTILAIAYRWFGSFAAAVALLAADSMLFLVLVAWRWRRGLSETGEGWRGLKVVASSGVAIAFWLQTRPLHEVAQAAAVAAGFFATYAMLGLLRRDELIGRSAPGGPT